jgi:predicted enzyme related to lactoylglutathione lyase
MLLRKTLILLASFATLVSCTAIEQPDLGSMTFSDDPLVGKVIWRDLVTEDIDAARRFYAGLFGWTFEDAAARGSTREDYIVALQGDLYVAGFVPVSKPADGTRLSRWVPYVSVEDVDVAADLAVAAGGSIAVGPTDVALGRVAAIIDKDGAVMGLARSRIGDPDDRTTAAAPGRPIWTELISNNPEAARDFYTKVIGFETREIERSSGTYTILLADGRERAGLFANPAPSWTPTWLTYFGVRDPAAAARRAEEFGGTILVDAAPDVREGTMAVVADPSGAVLVLQQYSTQIGALK